MIAVLLLAAQIATPAAPRPVAGSPPERIDLTNCPKPTGDEIVVCGDNGSQRLPLPDERGAPDVPRRPTGDPRAGLDNAGTGACTSSQRGCLSSVNVGSAGVAAIRLVGKLIDPNSCCDEPGQATSLGALARDVGKLFRKKPDTSNRVAIDLNAPPPSTTGRLSP